jgi:hypothetical protein
MDSVEIPALIYYVMSFFTGYGMVSFIRDLIDL